MVLEALRKNIKKHKYQAIMLTGLENPIAAKNLRYVTGYTGSYGVAIVTEEKQFFLTDFRYRDQVKMQCPEFTYVEISESLIKGIQQVLEENNISSIGFDKKMRFSEYELYQKLEVELIPMNNVIETLRVSKMPNEMELIKKACEITDQALEYTLSLDLVGMKERDVEVILKSKMLELGANNTWDRFIVASGERGAMPHGMASEKIIQNNEFVTFDIGCEYNGYTSDLTRTVAFGNPDPKLVEIYNVVYEAQVKAVAAAKAGMTGKELDAICRDYITEKGYGEYFKHGTGHGIGLDVHEGPRVSAANTNPLELGAVVTVEPGIYITGLGGVRIEDDIILTEEGCIVLNMFPKELIRK
jgi:Xaa-Pro aminopeptidase